MAGLKWEDPAMMTADRSTCSVGYVRSGTGDTPRNPFQNGDSPHPENPECKYSSTFNGTSSAAPTVAGSVAMILEANNNLTWRDMKHILASTSAITDSSRSYDIDGINQYSWVTNFAGYSHHNWYGFGVVDIDAAISMAENYNFPLEPLEIQDRNTQLEENMLWQMVRRQVLHYHLIQVGLLSTSDLGLNLTTMHQKLLGWN